MEAAILGRPVVAFNVGGLSEVVINEESGLIVAAEDVSEFARAVLRLLEDSELWEKFRKNAKSRAQCLFNPSEMAAKYSELYSGVILD